MDIPIQKSTNSTIKTAAPARSTGTGRCRICHVPVITHFQNRYSTHRVEVTRKNCSILTPMSAILMLRGMSLPPNYLLESQIVIDQDHMDPSLMP